MIEHLRVTAEQFGLPFGARTRTYNSRLAQELGLWAEERGKGDAFHRAAFRAYFADGKNLAKLPVLLELADAAGLPEEEAKEVLENRTYREKVDKDWEYSRLHGITAVPTFMMGRQRLVGAQSYQILAEMVTSYGAVRKKQAAGPQ